MPAKKKENASGFDNENDLLSSILEEEEKYHLNFKETVTWNISTGSLLLDMAVKGIGPSMVRLCGFSGEGKSAMAVEIMRNFLTTVPNSKAMWIIAEGRGLSDEHRNRCGLPFTTKTNEWNDGSVFVLKTNVYDTVVKTIKKLVDINPQDKRYCFVIDSFDGLKLKQDLETKDIWDPNQKVAGAPMLTKRFLSTMSLKLFDQGHLLIGISQQATPIKLNQYEKTPDSMVMSSGGKASEHYPDLILEFSKTGNSNYIMDRDGGYFGDGKSKAIGKFTKITIQKTSVETSRKQVIQYPVKYGKKPCGVWVEREIVDLLLALEFISKRGAWLEFESSFREELIGKGFEVPEKFQGLNRLYEFMERDDNARLRDYLFAKLKALALPEEFTDEGLQESE